MYRGEIKFLSVVVRTEKGYQVELPRAVTIGRASRDSYAHLPYFYVTTGHPSFESVERFQDAVRKTIADVVELQPRIAICGLQEVLGRDERFNACQLQNVTSDSCR